MQVRHPLTLITKETRPLDITVKNTCLLLQDLHSPFTDADEGWLVKRINQKVLMREFDDYFHLLSLIRPNIPRVLEAARQMGIRVAYSCFGYGADESPSLFQEATGWTWNLDGPLGPTPGRVAAGGRRSRLLQTRLERPSQPQIRRLSCRKQHCQRRHNGRNAGLRRPADLPRAQRPGNPEPDCRRRLLRPHRRRTYFHRRRCGPRAGKNPQHRRTPAPAQGP